MMDAMQDSQRAPRRPRYGAYTDGDREELAVKVTAADFNGESFDGRPFTAMPDWLKDAIKSGGIVPYTRGSTDYAQWDVATKKGIVNATPDDWIVRRESGELSVVDGRDAFVLINLRPPVGGSKEDALP